MLEIDVALARVLELAQPLAPRRLPLEQARGLKLAENVASDCDSPPYDKSVVDGFAIQASDMQNGFDQFTVLEVVTAGQLPRLSVTPGTATRIMTGAAIPHGATAVVMVEHAIDSTTPLCQEKVRFSCGPVANGANIMRRGEAVCKGQIVVSAGKRIRPIECGILAEAGCFLPLVAPRPVAAILVTGDELTPVGQTPLPGQIRDSNGPLLRGLVEAVEASPVELAIGRDTEPSLATLIRRGLTSDVLLISGGVSAGMLDLTPKILQSLGVTQVFHKVRLKPGQPLWFGVFRHHQQQTLVFGLPGNPVSALVCFELFVRPALRSLSGESSAGHDTFAATLAQPFHQRGQRPAYYPASLVEQSGKAQVFPLPWRGSADLAAFAAANALAIFPAGERTFPAGEEIQVMRLTDSSR